MNHRPTLHTAAAGRSLLAMLAALATMTFAWSQPLAPVQIPDSFRSQIITTQMWHRTGAAFALFAESPMAWRPVRAANFPLAPDDTHWMYAVLENTGPLDRRLKLYLQNVQVGWAKLYVVTDGRVDSSQITGCLVPASQRATADRTLSLPFTLPAGRTAHLYLRAWRRGFTATVTPTIQDPALCCPTDWTDFLVLIIAGFLLLLSFTAVLLWWYFPHRDSFWFAAYIFSGSLYFMAAIGYGSLYLWPDWGWFEENAAIFWGAVSAGCFFQFGRLSLKIGEARPRFDRFLLIFSVAYPAVATLGFGLFWGWMPDKMFSGLMGIAYLCLLAGLVGTFWSALRKAMGRGGNEFWWFVAIFAFHLFFVVATLALEVGWLRYNHRLHALMMALTVPPQLTLTLIFLANRLARMLIAQQRRELVLLQQLEHERTQLSRDFHDEMGAGLTKISLNSQVGALYSAGNADALARINAENARLATDLKNSLAEIVWMVNPRFDGLAEVAAWLREYTNRFFEDTPTVCHFDFDNAAIRHSTASFPPEARRHLFLFLKECLQNIAKHANAHEVNLSFRPQPDGTFVFEIRDDGKGFDPKNVRQFSNGLSSMRGRAEELGGTLAVETAPGRGTTVRLSGKI